MNLKTRNAMVQSWLFMVAGLVAFLVLFGGFTRLMRAGLSIVEWNPVSGVIPPLTTADWEEEFAKYQQSPEYQKINTHFGLAEYQEIFWIEWVHRLIARLAGLAVTLPLLYFLWKKIIPWKESLLYWLIIAMFGLQGFFGWYMVSSGLVENPAVSHFRLTLHLLTALLLLGMCLWLGLGHKYGFAWKPARGKTFNLTLLALGLLVLQISYGGLTAGLKAGFISATWPLMFGRWIPQGLFTLLEPWYDNLIENSITVFFIHRWLAFAVLFAVLGMWWAVRRQKLPVALNNAHWMLGLVITQVLMGIFVTVFHVAIPLALIHQGIAMALLTAGLAVIFHLKEPKY